MKKIFLLFLIILVYTGYSYAQFDYIKVTPDLAGKLSALPENEKLRVFINLSDRVDTEEFVAEMNRNSIPANKRSEMVIRALQEKANTSQKNLLDHLAVLNVAGSVDEYESYWIANVIWMIADVRTIKFLTYRPDIELIEIDYPIEFEEPEITSTSGTLESIEIGLRVVKADRMWRLGFTGEGVLVMNIDSGVDGNHPAINYKWKGNTTPWYHAWLDANGSSSPSWCSSHGTHTMGTMCGLGPATGDTIGVAFGATWMAAKRSCSGNYSTFGITAMQWAVDPDSNPATNDAPIVINCSWTTTDPSSNQCNGTYRSTLLALEAAGLAVVWSAGNSGPGASTITSPKNINANIVNSFAVGALDGNNPSYPIASFSSRGPSICGGTGSLLIKPEVSAPGVNVRSSVLSNGYGLSSGTSMAAPHVSGCVALLKSFAPNLTSRQILEGLYFSATDLGPPGEDNTYGMGLVDVIAAMEMVGPQINHTPLSDTTDINGPYRVMAEITPSTITESPVDTNAGKLKVMWGRGSSVTDSINMQRLSGNEWYADIPGNGIPSEYVYYIKVFDTLDVRGQSPVEAPFELHSFHAGVTPITQSGKEIPSTFKLSQNYPNPFNPVTSIKFDIPAGVQADGVVKLSVFNSTGQEITILVNNILTPGSYEVSWDASEFASGVYFYRIQSGQFIETKRMLLIK